MRLLVSLTPIVVVCLASCAVEFDVPVDGETVVEQATPFEEFIGAFGFSDFALLDLSTTQEFENNDVRKDQVEEARLVSLSLAIVDPPGATFDFLDEISFLVSTPDLDEVEVAEKRISEGSISIDLDVNDIDLSRYVRSPTMSITTDVTGRRPPEDTTIRALLAFHIKANPFGSTDPE